MHRSVSSSSRATLALVAVLGGLMLLTPEASPSPQGRDRSVRSQRFRGHVTPSRSVELRAPIEDLLRAVEVTEGDQVKAEQVLARLDDRLQVAAVEAARLGAESEAEARGAALDLEEAEENLLQLTRAFERNAANDVEMRRARIAVGRAKAAQTAALENRALAAVKLKMEEQRLSRYRVVAPFDGTVIRMLAEPGAMLTVQDTILVLVDLATLEAQINLPAALYGQLTIGGSYTLVAEQPVNTQLEARLQSAEPIIDTASQTFRCVFAIDNAETELPAGFTVHLNWPQVQPAPIAGAADEGGRPSGQ